MASNEKHIQTLFFDFNDNLCNVTMKTDTATYNLSFGAGKWQKGETTMQGPYLVNAQHKLVGQAPFKIADDYTWVDDNTLKLVMRYIESPHTEIMICHFDGNKIKLDIGRSFNTTAPDAVVTMEGEMKQ